MLRLTLILQLVLALQCRFLCEQPVGSEYVFARHPRFEAFCNECAFVTEQHLNNMLEHFFHACLIIGLSSCRYSSRNFGCSTMDLHLQKERFVGATMNTFWRDWNLPQNGRFIKTINVHANTIKHNICKNLGSGPIEKA